MTPAAETTTITIRMDADTSSVTSLLPALQTDAKLTIADESTFAQVAQTALAAKDRIKELRELPMFYGTAQDPGSIVLAHNTHAKLMEQFNAVHAILKKIVDDCEGAMRRFRLEQKAAADRARQISDEAIRKENVERQRAVEEEAASKQRQAELLRKLGMAAEATKVEAAPAPVFMPMPTVQVVVPTAPKVQGLTEKFPFEGKVVDKMATIRAIASGAIPLTYLNAKGEPKDLLEVNETLLNFLAKQRQADLGIPGCSSAESVSFSRSRRS